MTTLRIKEWFENKIQMEASRYNMLFNVKYTEINGIRQMDTTDGYVTVEIEEVIKETEKAMQIKIATGHIDGSTKGYTTWIPKSVIG